MGKGYAGKRLLDHETGHQPGGSDADLARGAPPRGQGGPALARVCGEWQIRGHGWPSAESHGGLSSWQDDMTLEDVCDIEAATQKLARQAPLWAPGTAMGYHGVTQGFLIGELVRRKTCMSIEEFVTEEICRPLGDGTDFQLVGRDRRGQVAGGQCWMG
ncbi:hypothetical protein ACJZ2D_009531 [Fusarium nematophilum]